MKVHESMVLLEGSRGLVPMFKSGVLVLLRGDPPTLSDCLGTSKLSNHITCARLVTVFDVKFHHFLNVIGVSYGSANQSAR